jgi:hypothetical protein
MSFIERLRQAQAELAERDTDPFRQRIEDIMGCVGDCVSTVALLDLLGLPKTTGNGRRIAATMRSLGFVPIKSRRLMPGGFGDTVTRGWVRPVRRAGSQKNLEKGVTVKPSHSHPSMKKQTQQKVAYNVQ